VSIVANVPRRPATSAAPDPSFGRRMAALTPQGEAKKLTVGRDIALTGEIKSCDTLVVEGEVRAALDRCRTLEIARSGAFHGDAEIAVADIAGLFEGVLTVRDRLILRATGRMIGTIRYREIEIERGGTLAGTVEILGADDPVTAEPEPVEFSGAS